MSYYQGFYMRFTDENGAIVPVPSTKLIIYDVDAGRDVGTTRSDENCYVPAGALPAPVGTRLRFRVENFQGMAGTVSQVTKEQEAVHDGELVTHKGEPVTW